MYNWEKERERKEKRENIYLKLGIPKMLVFT